MPTHHQTGTQTSETETLPQTAKPAVHCEGLTRVFRRGRTEVHAVSELDLDVPYGKVFGLLGPNGAGKTTTVRMLTGQLPPSSGSAYVAGCDVRKDRKRLHGRIGVVFDQPNLYDQLSGRQNLSLFASLYGIGKQRIREVLEQVDMTKAADRAFKSYSRGMKQRIVMARALLHEPPVLFLDEPTLGLDPSSQASIRDLISQTAQRGTTVLLTTHDMTLADRLCDELAILNEGRIVASGRPAELKRAQGESRLLIELKEGETIELDMDAKDTAKRIADLLGSGKVENIETRTPSLEDVFLALTGRRLS